MFKLAGATVGGKGAEGGGGEVHKRRQLQPDGHGDGARTGERAHKALLVAVETL